MNVRARSRRTRSGEPIKTQRGQLSICVISFKRLAALDDFMVLSQ
jgi:hypothetical protein